MTLIGLLSMIGDLGFVICLVIWCWWFSWFVVVLVLWPFGCVCSVCDLFGFLGFVCWLVVDCLFVVVMLACTAGFRICLL